MTNPFFFYKPSRSEANLWLRVLFQVFYALTCSWVRLLVALRPSSWMWFCSSWIIWGKPVDTARSKTYIFAMSERKKNSSIFQTTLCNAHFKMQRWKKCVDKDTPHLNTKAPSVPSHHSSFSAVDVMQWWRMNIQENTYSSPCSSAMCTVCYWQLQQILSILYWYKEQSHKFHNFIKVTGKWCYNY